MSNESVKEVLRTLTITEAAILYWKCRGLTYKEIGVDVVGLAETTVQYYMSSVYRKLRFPSEMHGSKRNQLLKEIVCPVIDEMVDDPGTIIDKWPPDEGEPEPDSTYYPLVLIDQGREEAEEEYDERNRALQKVEPPVTVISTPIIENGRRRWIIWLAAGTALIAVLACLAIAAYWLGRTMSPADPTGVVAIHPTDIIDVLPTEIDEIAEVPPSAEPTIATSITPIPADTQSPTNTALPPTNTPAPLITLPFSDNFDNGIKPEWKTLYGDWFTSDGSLTMFSAPGDWQYISLDDPTWTNYKVSLDAELPHFDSAAGGKVIVGIRVTSQQRDRVVFLLRFIQGGGWAIMEAGSTLPKTLAPDEGISIKEQNHVVLEAYGDNFTAYLNGQMVQTISLKNFESGSIVLGAYCVSELACPKFDNVLIEPNQ